MRRLLALVAVPALGLLVLVPAPARAQGNGPCIHLGQQVQCPPGLPPGSQSVGFVPGGTNWRNSATGAIVFVPSTTFPPFMAGPTPTAPPGPTTQPGPGTQPTSPTPGPRLTAAGVFALTSPGDRVEQYYQNQGSTECTGLAGLGPEEERFDTAYGRLLQAREGAEYERAAKEYDAAAKALEAVKKDPSRQFRFRCRTDIRHARGELPPLPGSAEIQSSVQQSDVEKAPTFVRPASPVELDQVM